MTTETPEDIPREADHTVKTPDKIGAYSEIGYINVANAIMHTIDHLDEKKKWNNLPPILRGKHRANGELTFGDALQAMQMGYDVTRREWLAQEPCMNPIALGWKVNKIRDVVPVDLSVDFKHPTFVRKGNPRYATELTELPVTDLVATDWMVLQKDERLPAG